jgi:hypothetical protein
MDIIKVRDCYQVTISRRALLLILALVSFCLGSGVVLAVAPILRDAVVMTHRNAEGVRKATEQQRQLRAQIESLMKEIPL